MRKLALLISVCITLPTIGMLKKNHNEHSANTIELPNEIKCEIANFCISSIKDTFISLNALSQVNKQWNTTINDEIFKEKVAGELGISPFLLRLYKSKNKNKSKQMITKITKNKHELFKTYQVARYINHEFNTKKSQVILELLKQKIRTFYTKIEHIHWVYPDNSFLIQPVYSISFILYIKKPNKELERSFKGHYKCSINKVEKRNNDLDKTGGVVSITDVGIGNNADACIAIQNNKKIVIGLASQQRNIFLIRLLMNGNLDITFGDNGITDTKIKYSYEEPYSMASQLILEDLTINPQTNDIIFKAMGQVKKYTADGIEIQ